MNDCRYYKITWANGKVDTMYAENVEAVYAFADFYVDELGYPSRYTVDEYADEYDYKSQHPTAKRQIKIPGLK